METSMATSYGCNRANRKFGERGAKMMQRRRAILGVMTVACLMLGLTAASAQTSANNITGVVKDATDLVMPGVTVEVSSPALVEKVRTAVTDTQGQYRIVSLPPGTYAVTFTLPGFTTVK